MDDSPPDYSLNFVDAEAYAEWAEVDCPELRALIAGLHENPFPDGRTKRARPGVLGVFFTFSEVDGFVYKMAYRIDTPNRSVIVLATSVQRLPIFGPHRESPDDPG